MKLLRWCATFARAVYLAIWHWFRPPLADVDEILARPSLTWEQREIILQLQWQCDYYGDPLTAEDAEWGLEWIDQHGSLYPWRKPLPPLPDNCPGNLKKKRKRRG